jgi:flagellar hook assembly protein FlgD
MTRAFTARLLVPALFAALVLATLAAFVVAQRVKRTGLVLDRVKVTHGFTPNGNGITDRARFRFRLTRPDEADVQIINRDDELVRTIASGRPLRSYHYYVFHWNGRTDSGAQAPRGKYRIRVVLRNQGRTVVPEKTMLLRRPPPLPPRDKQRPARDRGAR